MTIQSYCFAAPEDIDLKAAQDEWDAVATITIGDLTHQATGDSADGESVPNPTKPVAAPNVTFTQAIDHFQTHTDLVIYKVREHFLEHTMKWFFMLVMKHSSPVQAALPVQRMYGMLHVYT